MKKQIKIVEALTEKLKKKKISLDEQYKQLSQDEEVNREFKEWDKEMLEDGLNGVI